MAEHSLRYSRLQQKLNQMILQVVARLHERLIASGELCTEADSWYRRHPRGESG